MNVNCDLIVSLKIDYDSIYAIHYTQVYDEILMMIKSLIPISHDQDSGASFIVLSVKTFLSPNEM